MEMPWEAISVCMACEKWVTKAFDAPYTLIPGEGNSPATEEIFMTTPFLSCRRKFAIAARVSSNGAIALTSAIDSCSSLVRVIGSP